MKMMMTAIAATALLTVPALAQSGDAKTEIVSYSCEEHRALTSQDLCSTHKTLRTSRARLEGMRQAATRKACLARAVEAYGEKACFHNYNKLIDKSPDGYAACRAAKAACERPKDNVKQPAPTIDVWK
ncbi:hypothetical protein ACFFUB_00550 [Algimonas porphyrae]|uniref:Uncharacterized protein n=1 Tax=Algimonas porphyrae TaxID=1128113 RepID=A0ABQ5UYZ8_9PROT|nr:hypothetical protein [Algimonas porphyrae]GLQ20520.1 hypothetical protein GCM10007854_14750 [Algimonas porphyrae]